MGHPMGPRLGSAQQQGGPPGSGRDQRGAPNNQNSRQGPDGSGERPLWMAEAANGGAKRTAMTAADMEAERQAMQEHFRKAKSAPPPSRPAVSDRIWRGNAVSDGSRANWLPLARVHACLISGSHLWFSSLVPLGTGSKMCIG